MQQLAAVGCRTYAPVSNAFTGAGNMQAGYKAAACCNLHGRLAAYECLQAFAIIKPPLLWMHSLDYSRALAARSPL
jgi:hypothetical protein